MSLSDNIDIRWTILAALAAAWSLKLSLSVSITDQVYGIIGIVTILMLVAVYHWAKANFKIFWDEQTGTLSIVRSWTVEMYTTRLISSVPQGIDLRHSASRVMASMHARYEDAGKGTLEFHVCRPIKDGPTLVGFTACRKQWRFSSLKRQMTHLNEKLFEDGMIVEASMQASYPHTPIKKAGLEHNLMIRSGGTDVHGRG